MRAPNFTRVQAAFVAYVAGIFTCLLIMLCGKDISAAKAKDKDTKPEQEYYFIDRFQTLHVDGGCSRIVKHNGIQTAERLPKDGYIDYNHICTMCVSDMEYDQVKGHNIHLQKLHILYRHLHKEYDSVSINEFVRTMRREEEIKKLYKHLTKESGMRELGTSKDFKDNITSYEPVHFIYISGGKEYAIPQRLVNTFEEEHSDEKLIGIKR